MKSLNLFCGMLGMEKIVEFCGFSKASLYIPGAVFNKIISMFDSIMNCMCIKALQSLHVSKPRVITGYKNPAYPIAIEKLKKEKMMSAGIQMGQLKY